MSGKLRVALFVRQGPNGEEIYRSDDHVYETGDVVDVPHGKAIEIKFPVYSEKRVRELREMEMKANALLYEKKDYLAAISAYNELLKESPMNLNGLRGRAIAHYEAGQDVDALADLNAVLSRFPEDTIAVRYLSILLASSSNPEVRNSSRAVKLAEKYLTDARASGQAPPETVADAMSNLAAAHAEAGQFDKAVAEQREALELAPKERHAKLEMRLKLYQESKPYRRKP
jgi:tetratricopeptide (TPR) repeat protein